MTVSNPKIRSAVDTDADEVAEAYLRSRKELVACAPLVHSDDSVRDWIRRELIPYGNVSIAILDDGVAGFVAVSRTSECGWIDHLYVHPDMIRRAVGTALLNHARNEMSPPIRLYTFQCNAPARQFYEYHGFKAIAETDGSANEEHCPDILYEWMPE